MFLLLWGGGGGLILIENIEHIFKILQMTSTIQDLENDKQTNEGISLGKVLVITKPNRYQTESKGQDLKRTAKTYKSSYTTN